ncbi:MAG: preprotein translocase subunit SecG [Sphingobacteriales bacterium]|nr:preprotein translocase subunit SecG [Sphingobacteriales bacterium]
MTTLFIILIILASGILALIVLVQNPKGGGLAGNIAGFSTQFMGVKQTTDVLEKGTWLFAGIIGVLCLVSSFFISGRSGVENKAKDAPINTTQQPVTNPGLQLNPPPATNPSTNPPR